MVVLAGDTSPIDVYSHMPVACEEAGVPYCYVPSREVCLISFMLSHGILNWCLWVCMWYFSEDPQCSINETNSKAIIGIFIKCTCCMWYSNFFLFKCHVYDFNFSTHFIKICTGLYWVLTGTQVFLHGLTVIFFFNIIKYKGDLLK